MSRPRKYATAAKLGIAIDAYFAKCTETKEWPTMCGLAIGLGFVERKSLFDYKGYGTDYYTLIKKAVLLVEQAYEERLAGKTPAGAIFALKNMGWTDRHEEIHGVTDQMAQLMERIAGKDGIKPPSDTAG